MGVVVNELSAATQFGHAPSRGSQRYNCPSTPNRLEPSDRSDARWPPSYLGHERREPLGLAGEEERLYYITQTWSQYSAAGQRTALHSRLASGSWLLHVLKLKVDAWPRRRADTKAAQGKIRITQCHNTQTPSRRFDGLTFLSPSVKVNNCDT